MAEGGSLPAITALPAVHPELGRVVSVHHGRPLAGGMWLYLGVLFGVAGLYGVGQSVVSVFEGLPDAESLTGGLGALGASALMLVRSLYLWKQTLGIYEGGFAVQRLTGTRTIPWSTVRSASAVSERDSWGSRLVIDVALAGGGGVTLTDAIDGAAGLVPMFQNRGGYRG